MTSESLKTTDTNKKTEKKKSAKKETVKKKSGKKPRVTKAEKEKQQLALAIVNRLKEAYPDVDCTLEYDQAWKLLVSVRLAAQCTDARVNVVVQDLYAKYPTQAALAEASVEDIEAIVWPCGLGPSKARDISACMKILQEEYGGYIKTMWCGELECELAMKEKAGMSSRCIPFAQEKLGDTCACCGKPASKMVYWGVAY